MIDPLPAALCPVSSRPCPETPACHAALVSEGTERATLLVLRFLAAARDTGDACCWDAALDQAEAAFGERLGPLVVGYAGALIRRLARAGTDLAFLPPPCRRLSTGEALLLGALRSRPPRPREPELGAVSEDVAALAHSIAAAETPQPRQAA